MRKNYLLRLTKYIKNAAISAQCLQSGLIRRYSARFEMYRIRNFFMVLPRSIGFDIISEKGG